MLEVIAALVKNRSLGIDGQLYLAENGVVKADIDQNIIGTLV